VWANPNLFRFLLKELIRNLNHGLEEVKRVNPNCSVQGTIAICEADESVKETRKLVAEREAMIKKRS